MNRISFFFGAALLSVLFFGSCAKQNDLVPEDSAIDTDLRNGKTAQSIMMDFGFTGNQTFILTEEYNYTWNPTLAATYYTNDWNGVNPTATCGGPGCAGKSAPPAPARPAADASILTDKLNTLDWECSFWNGGTLCSHTYTKTAQVVIGSGGSRETWTFVWTYNITPTQTVDPKTAWDEEFVGAGGTKLPIIGKIAAMSVVQMSGKNAGNKYDFGLTNADGTSRIENLRAELWFGNTKISEVVLPHNVNINYDPTVPRVPLAAGEQGAVDYNYFASPGLKFGNVGLLTEGDMRGILNGDAFAGNNNGGSDGSALALATIPNTNLEVPAGSPNGQYTVKILGTIKGNAGGADLTATISNSLIINGPNACDNKGCN